MREIYAEASKLEEMTDEELVTMIQSDSPLVEDAYRQLFINLKPTILGEAMIYKGRMVTYDTDDFLQEGFILIWKTIKNFKGGNYRNYFTSAMRYRLCKIYENYVLHNAICIAQSKSRNGYTISIFAESPKAQSYREKKNARQRKYAEKRRAKNRASESKPCTKPKLTEEELSDKLKKRAERHRASNLKYYNQHKEELNKKRREKRAADKSERTVKKVKACKTKRQAIDKFDYNGSASDASSNCPPPDCIKSN